LKFPWGNGFFIRDDFGLGIKPFAFPAQIREQKAAG